MSQPSSSIPRNSSNSPIPDVSATPVDETVVGPATAGTAAGASGTVLSMERFTVIRPVGQGGMGNVFLARHPVTESEVAVKCLKPAFLGNARAVQRFLAEARHMYHLNHPRILRIMEVGDGVGTTGGPFYVMPYMAAGPLAAKLTRGKPADPALALRVARDMAEALAYAHQKGIIHRDLKPANVLLDEDGPEIRACLADFGMVHEFATNDSVEIPGGMTFREGTVGYMSPAVARGEAEDTRCDIYSFGAMLCELLTGHVPYEGPTVPLTLEMIAAGGPVKILERNPNAPPALAAVAEGCLGRELRDRYARMSDVVADLERVAAGQFPVGPHGTWRRRTRPAVRAATAAGVLVAAALIIGVGVWVARWRRGSDADGRTVGTANTLPIVPLGVQPPPAAPTAPWAERTVDLTPLIDPESDATPGAARRLPDGIELADTGRDERVFLVLPYEPPAPGGAGGGGEYDLKIVLTRHTGEDGLDHCLVRGDRAFFWTLGGFGNSLSGFWWVGSGGFGEGNPTAVKRPEWMTTGERHLSEVRVRAGSVAAYFDGRKVCEYQTTYDDLHFPKDDEVPDAFGGRLGLSVLRGNFVIHQVQVTEHSGPGVVHTHPPPDPHLVWARRAGLALPYAVRFLEGPGGDNGAGAPAVLAATASPHQTRNVFTVWDAQGTRAAWLDGSWAVAAPDGRVGRALAGGRFNLTDPLASGSTAGGRDYDTQCSNAVAGAFSPDGTRVALVGRPDHSVVRVVHTGTGADVARVTLAGVTWVGFSPDGRRLAAAGRHEGKRVVAVWDAETFGDGREAQPMWRAEVPAESQAGASSGLPVGPATQASQAGFPPVVGTFSRSGRWLSARSGASVLLFDVNAGHAGQPPDPREIPHTAEVTAAAFAPRDDELLLTASADPLNGLHLWTDTARPVPRFTQRIGPVRAADVSADGKRVAAGGDDGVVRLFDFDTGAELTRFGGHGGPVSGVAISGDGKWVASACADGLVRLFRVPEKPAGAAQ